MTWSKDLTPGERKAKQREVNARFREKNPDYGKTWYENNKEVRRVQARSAYWVDPDKSRARSRARNRSLSKETRNDYARKARVKLRSEVYDHYGAYCACCGEKEQKFLTVDHVNGNGKEHRKTAGGVLGTLHDIRRRGFPPEFQILCFNCNQGRQLNGGICPHKS